MGGCGFVVYGWPTLPTLPTLTHPPNPPQNKQPPPCALRDPFPPSTPIDPTLTQPPTPTGSITRKQQALCEFATVEGFWRYFSFLPKPSEVFTEVAPASASSRWVRTLVYVFTLGSGCGSRLVRLPRTHPPEDPSLNQPMTRTSIHSHTHGSGPPNLIKRKLDGKSLEAFGLFKKGVKPEWEDPVNAQVGGSVG